MISVEYIYKLPKYKWKCNPSVKSVGVNTLKYTTKVRKDFQTWTNKINLQHRVQKISLN